MTDLVLYAFDNASTPNVDDDGQVRPRKFCSFTRNKLHSSKNQGRVRKQPNPVYEDNGKQVKVAVVMTKFLDWQAVHQPLG